MDNNVYSVADARQTDEWGIYLKQIGWVSEKVGNTLILIKQLKPLSWSIIKILHPVGPIPFSKIDVLARKYNALTVIIEPHIYKYDEKNFRDNKYRLSKIRFAHTATIKINLRQSEDALFKSFSENARRNIRKAQLHTIKIKKVFLKNEKNNSEFDIFYNLLFNLKEMKNFYIPPYEEYIKKMNAFKKTSILLFAYEANNDKPIAAVWLAHYKNVVSYFQTGITQKGYDVMANYLLVWEALKVGRSLDLDVFDFETIYDPRYPKDHLGWQGYTIFKKRFHGTIVEYPPSWIKLYNPFFKLFYLSTNYFIK